LADHLSEIGVSYMTIDADTAAEQHICVRRLINAASVHILLCNCLRAMIICLQVLSVIIELVGGGREEIEISLFISA